MKTYILKYDVYNSIEFPKGTIVKINDPSWEFEVVEGKLKGEKGNIAGGLDGWLLEDTKEHRKIHKDLQLKVNELQKEIAKINKCWNELEAVKL